MKDLKLQENESLIDSFELDICLLDEKLKLILESNELLNILWESPWLTKWRQAKLFFTNKKVELQFKNEQISLSYRDVKNFSFSAMRCRPRKTALYLFLSSFVGLAPIIISIFMDINVTDFHWVILFICVGLALLMIIFRWTKAYNIVFGEQFEFIIKKDETILEKIKEAYEKGKVN